MVVKKMLQGQNGIRTKWYTDKMLLDKIVCAKRWYGQNGTIFGIDYNSSEFNTYLVSKSHKVMHSSQS